MMNSLSSIPAELKTGGKHFVLVTSTPENALLREDINALFYLSWTISRGPLTALNLPNYERDRDAPKFDGEGKPGIAIHSDNKQVEKFVEQPFMNCFKVELQKCRMGWQSIISKRFHKPSQITMITPGLK
jgi:hypothetical protein